ETFPVGGRANQSLWEEVRVAQRGIGCGSQSTTLALFTFRAHGGKTQAQSPVWEIAGVGIGIILLKE
ncbi:hypothetical protein KUCAC02_024199, partial [Chaenocephalus aceratus]